MDARRAQRLFRATVLQLFGFLLYAQIVGLRGFLGNQEMITTIPSLQQGQMFLGAGFGASCFFSSFFPLLW